MGQAAMGPFHCPGDQKVYIALSFYRDLKEHFRASGNFAQAYVIAHEVGHHVQTLLGVSDEVQQAKYRASREEANAIQVKMELQADCLAGVWANYANPNSMAAQRQRWFNAGLESSCKTPVIRCPQEASRANSDQSESD